LGSQVCPGGFAIVGKSNKITKKMAKSELKTKQTDASVDAFLDSLADEQQRDDSRAIVEIMQRITGEKPKMWGPAIIGFGSTTLKYSSGRELDWMKLGFSPRKGNIVLYGMASDAKAAKDLGKFKTGKGCLYIKRLADVDEKVLSNLVNDSYKRKD
jgi:hypothetical protein